MSHDHHGQGRDQYATSCHETTVDYVGSKGATRHEMHTRRNR